MRTPGTLLASGRDSDIFEYGPGLVLRRSRDRRSMTSEARIMADLAAQGYPVPAVHEVSDDGFDLVMERVDGPTMVEAMAQKPWRIRGLAKTLAELHRSLHQLEAPDYLAPAPVGLGSSIVHMDLHPLNVILGPRGPVVIDWPRVAIGDPATDIGVAWLLMSAAEIPGGRAKAALMGLGRSTLVNAFLAGVDRVDVGAHLGAIVEWKARDPNMSEKEIDVMRAIADRARVVAR